MIIRSNKLTRLFEIMLGQRIRALAFYPFIIVPSSTLIDKILINHEKIHLRQQLEMLIIPFYICYIIALRRKGYMEISFEKEAFANESNMQYLKTRRMWSFLRY